MCHHHNAHGLLFVTCTQANSTLSQLVTQGAYAHKPASWAGLFSDAISALPSNTIASSPALTPSLPQAELKSSSTTLALCAWLAKAGLSPAWKHTHVTATAKNQPATLQWQQYLSSSRESNAHENVSAVCAADNTATHFPNIDNPAYACTAI